MQWEKSTKVFVFERGKRLEEIFTNSEQINIRAEKEETRDTNKHRLTILASCLSEPIQCKVHLLVDSRSEQKTSTICVREKL